MLMVSSFSDHKKATAETTLLLQDLRIGATRKAGKPRTQEFAGALRYVTIPI